MTYTVLRYLQKQPNFATLIVEKFIYVCQLRKTARFSVRPSLYVLPGSARVQKNRIIISNKYEIWITLNS